MSRSTAAAEVDPANVDAPAALASTAVVLGTSDSSGPVAAGALPQPLASTPLPPSPQRKPLGTLQEHNSPGSGAGAGSGAAGGSGNSGGSGIGVSVSGVIGASNKVPVALSATRTAAATSRSGTMTSNTPSLPPEVPLSPVRQQLGQKQLTYQQNHEDSLRVPVQDTNAHALVCFEGGEGDSQVWDATCRSKDGEDDSDFDCDSIDSANAVAATPPSPTRRKLPPFGKENDTASTGLPVVGPTERGVADSASTHESAAGAAAVAAYDESLDSPTKPAANAAPIPSLVGSKGRSTGIAGGSRRGIAGGGSKSKMFPFDRLGSLARKRPSAAAASISSASSSASVQEGEIATTNHMEESSVPSTPIRRHTEGAEAYDNNVDGADFDFQLKPRHGRRHNSGLPDVNNFPLGADGTKSSGGDRDRDRGRDRRGGSNRSASSGGALLRFKSKAAPTRSRKLNLNISSSSSCSSSAGLLDSNGMPMDMSLDMDEMSAAGVDAGYYCGYKSSPPRSATGSASQSSLVAAAAAAAAAAQTCPLTPTEAVSSRQLPTNPALLNTPPASSPSPLFVKAKQIGSDIRQRHGAKRRKGSSRRTKKARRSFKAAQKKAEGDAVAAVASSGGGSCDMDVDFDRKSLSSGICPRSLADSPSRGSTSSRPFPVDDGFCRNDCSQNNKADETEGDVSKSLEEMGLNTPTTCVEHGLTNNMTAGVCPSGQRSGAFPLVLQRPSSPSSSMSGSEIITRSAEDFDSGPWHDHHDRMHSGSSDSSSESDTDSDDDSTVCRESLPLPPDNATHEEISRFYYLQVYGAPPPGPQSSEAMNQGSWSAARAPPPKSCLSSLKKRPKAPGGIAVHANATPMLTDRTHNFVITSPVRGATNCVVSTPVPVDDKNMLLTPTASPPEEDSSEMSTEMKDDRPKLNVQFGESRAAEFDTTRPTVDIAIMPDALSSVLFPVEYVEEAEDEVHQQTKDNSLILNEWEDDFDSFVEDDSDQDTSIDGRGSDEDLLPSSSLAGPMDCEVLDNGGSDTSGFIADDDMTPLSRPRRPRKAKRRKSRHKYRSAEKNDRRQSHLFFSPGGGGSLLGSDDEERTRDDSTRMPEVTAGGSHSDSLYTSPPSSARSSFESRLQQNGHIDSPSSPFDSSKELFQAPQQDCDRSPSALLRNYHTAIQKVGNLSRPLSSICQRADKNKIVEEFMLRNDLFPRNTQNNSGYVDSICQVQPIIFNSCLPANVVANLCGDMSPSLRLAGVRNGNECPGNKEETTACFLTEMADVGLYEWRDKEVRTMNELALSSQEFINYCDTALVAIDTLTSEADDALKRAPRSISLSNSTSGGPVLRAKIVEEEINQLNKEIEAKSESLKAAFSLKQRRLSLLQLHAARLHPPKSELAYQCLSCAMPTEIASLGEDTLETAYHNSDGTYTHVNWRMSISAESPGSGPTNTSALSSPRAIDRFEVSSHTVESTTRPPVQKSSVTQFKEALLHNSMQGGNIDYHAALDRFIELQAKANGCFTSAFTATGDFLNKMSLVDIDVAEVEGQSCSLEIQQFDDSVGLLVKINLIDGSSMGVQLMYKQLGINSATLMPVKEEVSVVALGNEVASTADASLLRNLKSAVESIILQRQGCVAFLLKEIVSRVTEEVLASVSLEV